MARFRCNTHLSQASQKGGRLQVLLVGGATRMPAVRQFVQNMTGLTPRDGLVDPDAAVAAGAAVYAGVLSGQRDDVDLLDVWQSALLRCLLDDRLKAGGEMREEFMQEPLRMPAVESAEDSESGGEGEDRRTAAESGKWQAGADAAASLGAAGSAGVPGVPATVTSE